MKMIIQYFEEVDAEFSIPEFDMSRYSSIAKFYEVERFNIFEAMYIALGIGVNMHYPVVPCFAILTSPAIITIEKYQYLEKIEECLTFFIDQEEFEKCNILQKLKEKICQEIQELSI